MRVLHFPYTYYPDPPGGTEVYVAALARELRALGVHSTVAAPGTADARYEHEGSAVVRYRLAPVADRAELYEARANRAAPRAIDEIIAGAGPDVLHLHAYTSGVPLEAGRSARARGIPVVVTYHSPTVTCPNGTLIRDGEHVCDGALDVRRCARSVVRSMGHPSAMAAVVSRVPTSVGRIVGRLAPTSGGALGALRTTQLVAARHARVAEHLRLADIVVAPSLWVRDLLQRIGVAPAKIVVSPQGIDALPTRTPGGRREGTVRLVILGRYSREKGLHVAVEAVRSRPDAPVLLDVYGAAQGHEGLRYRAELAQLAGGDARIRLLDAVGRGTIDDVLARAHGLLVPSLVLETGPLTVLEAQAAATPVLGSRLGGIAERVRDGVDGLLLPPGDVQAWADAIASFATDARLRERLAAAARPPRTMRDVAEEMAGVYARLVPMRSPLTTRVAG